MIYSRFKCTRQLTSLLIQLLQHLANDLSHALQSLDVVLCLIEILDETLDLLPEALELRFPLPRLNEFGAEVLEGVVPLLVGSHDV